MIEREWFSHPTNYVVASGDCFNKQMGNFIDKFGGDKYLKEPDINKFLLHNVDKFLYSFGSGLSYKRQKMGKSHVSKIIREVNKIRNRPFMKDTKLYIDSGGFQVAMGAILPEDMPDFINVYHEFIKNNRSSFDYAFNLDLPPGPNTNVFKSYEQLEDLNRQSYTMTSELSQEVKDQMIYVHHFRTPSLYKTWRKFLFEENLAKGFTHFATGGIVAGLESDLSIPAIIYTLPISEVLLYAKSINLKKFNFHVLGASNYIDIFYHKLFSHHIKQVHNIDINITYDSSAIFKALTVARIMPTLTENNTVMKMDIRSNILDLRFEKNMTKKDTLFYMMNKLAEIYGFTELDRNNVDIYDSETNSMTRVVHMYLMMMNLRNFKQLEIMSEELVDKVYPYYTSGDIEQFDKLCFEHSRKMNQGKNTKKQKAKISSIAKSLNILTNLDCDYNEYLIKKFMSNDDPRDKICQTLTF